MNHPVPFQCFCRTLGLVFQSENFSYNHYNNYMMDSWSYLNNPVPEPNHPKHRLHPADNFAALTMLQEHCKVNAVQFKPDIFSFSHKPNFSCVDVCFGYFLQNQKEQKGATFTRASNICKPVER